MQSKTQAGSCTQRIVLTTMIACAANSYAQPENTKTNGLEEVVVTAQKREENLQDTPISITALTETNLESMGINNITDFSKYTPNLHITQTAGDNTTVTVQMRGTSTTNPAIAFEPTVGFYMDGVFIAKSAGSVFDFADLERIEVLRGPQGTLYGKNTIGGAINLINKKPSGEFGVKATVDVGNYDLIKTKFVVDLPAVGTVGDGIGQLSAKIAYSDTDRDGFWKNRSVDGFFNDPASTDDFSNQDQKSGRIALHLDVTDNFDVAYAYDFNRTNQNSAYFQLTDITPNGIFDPDGFLCSPTPIPSACFANTGMADFASEDRETRGSLDQAGENDLDVDGHSLTMTWDAGDLGALGNVVFKSITAKREFTETAQNDLDGTPIFITAFGRENDYEQFSQEFQMLGTKDRLNYTLGLYYFEEEATNLGPQQFFGYFEKFGVPGGPNTNDYSMDNDAQAIFGQVDWTPDGFDDRLTLSLGGRYTEESKEMSRVKIDYDGTVIVPAGTTVDEDFDNFSVTFSTSWALNEDAQVYAKYAEGYKSGGFNQSADSIEQFMFVYDEEQLTSYEVGLKSRWLDNRVQVNVAAFLSDYDNLQLSNFIPSTSGGAVSITDNAGKAEIAGLELEVIAVPTPDLTIMFTLGVLDADYDEYLAYDETLGRDVNVADDRVHPFVADYSGSVNISYDIAQTDWGTLAVSVDYSFTDDFYTYSADPNPAVVGNSSTTHIDSYEVINARLTLSEIALGGGNLSISAWGKNLADEEYYTHGINFGAFGYTGNHWADPRTYGVSLTYEF